MIYRAYFSTPPDVTTPEGTSINAAHGFLSMVASLVDIHDPDFIACADDASWRPKWRIELLPEYKGERASDPHMEGGPLEEAEPWTREQVPITYELLGRCGVTSVGHPGYEAEDVIGSLMRVSEPPIGIVSGDRDLFQLVRDPEVFVIYPRRGVSNATAVDESYVSKKYEIPGRAYGDYAVLRGDPSDGLPGVRGIGEKTASMLITKYGSLERVIEAAMTTESGGPLSKVAASLDYLDKAVRVTTIVTDLDLDSSPSPRPNKPPSEETFELAEKWGLLGPLRRLVKALVR